MSQYRVDFKSLSWETPIAGLRCKARKHDARQLRIVEYTQEMEPHWCEKGHVGYILEGRFEIRFKGETTVYEAGDGVFIPPGADHQHMGKALSDVVRVVFVEDL